MTDTEITCIITPTTATEVLVPIVWAVLGNKPFDWTDTTKIMLLSFARGLLVFTQSVLTWLTLAQKPFCLLTWLSIQSILRMINSQSTVVCVCLMPFLLGLTDSVCVISSESSGETVETFMEETQHHVSPLPVSVTEAEDHSVPSLIINTVQISHIVPYSFLSNCEIRVSLLDKQEWIIMSKESMFHSDIHHYGIFKWLYNISFYWSYSCLFVNYSDIDPEYE